MYLGTALELALGLDADVAVPVDDPLLDMGNGELDRLRLIRPALFGTMAEPLPITKPEDVDGGGGEYCANLAAAVG